VHGKLVGRGLCPDDAWEAALSPIREAVPITAEHARLVGDLVAQTRPLGLSLGDRACLALVSWVALSRLKAQSRYSNGAKAAFLTFFRGENCIFQFFCVGFHAEYYHSFTDSDLRR
jgi:PIN domain nuclease of toxin-antitoxin system